MSNKCCVLDFRKYVSFWNMRYPSFFCKKDFDVFLLRTHFLLPCTRGFYTPSCKEGKAYLRQPILILIPWVTSNHDWPIESLFQDISISIKNGLCVISLLIFKSPNLTPFIRKCYPFTHQLLLRSWQTFIDVSVYT